MNSGASIKVVVVVVVVMVVVVGVVGVVVVVGWPPSAVSDHRL